MVTLRGRTVVPGRATGIALVTDQPIGFLGGVDPETGRVVERGHPLEGRSIAGAILVFPHGKGSTVGSYVIYRLARAGLAPRAIVNRESEAIIAVGALIAGIPMVDRIDISRLGDGMRLVVDGETLYVE